MVKPVFPQPKGTVRYDGVDEHGTHYWEEIKDGCYTEQYEAFESQDAEGKIVRYQNGVWVWAPDVNTIHQREMEYRKGMDEYTNWKTPPPLNCLRYAASEANEARQAWMDQTVGDPRNNEAKAEDRKKEGSVQRELAETAFMLMAALGKNTSYDVDCEEVHLKDGDLLDHICYKIEMAVMTANSYDVGTWNTWRGLAHVAISMIMNYPGVDLDEQQKIWHEKITAKNFNYKRVN